MIEHPLFFASLALAAIATPGPTTLLAMQNGSQGGVRAALPGVAGAVLSDLLLIAAVAAGIGGLLTASAMAFETLKWLGVAYLCWLGLRLLRSAPVASDPHATPQRQPPARIFRQCLLVALTNPKGYLFFSALLPSFIDPGKALWPQYAAVTTLFVGLDAMVMLAYAALGSTGARWAGARTWHRVNRVSGALLLATAGSLSLLRRPGIGGPV
jgi:threonine/homoserine/homoserine lactone efflux protein